MPWLKFPETTHERLHRIESEHAPRLYGIDKCLEGLATKIQLREDVRRIDGFSFGLQDRIEQEHICLRDLEQSLRIAESKIEVAQVIHINIASILKGMPKASRFMAETVKRHYIG